MCVWICVGGVEVDWVIVSEKAGIEPSSHPHSHAIRKPKRIGAALHSLTVSRAHDDGAPYHDGNHLGAFAKRLKREGDVLECFVLAKRRHHIGNRDCRICMRRGHRPKILAVCLERKEVRRLNTYNLDL